MELRFTGIELAVSPELIAIKHALSVSSWFSPLDPSMYLKLVSLFISDSKGPPVEMIVVGDRVRQEGNGEGNRYGI
jgi:hypothetical protein